MENSQFSFENKVESMLKESAWPWNWGKKPAKSPSNPQFQNPSKPRSIDLTDVQTQIDEFEKLFNNLRETAKNVVRQIKTFKRTVPNIFSPKNESPTNNATQHPFTGIYHYIEQMSPDHYESTLAASYNLLKYIEKRKQEFESNPSLVVEFKELEIQARDIFNNISITQKYIDQMTDDIAKMEANKNFQAPGHSTLPGIGDFCQTLFTAVNYLEENPLSDNYQRQVFNSIGFIKKFLNGEYQQRIPALQRDEQVVPHVKNPYVEPPVPTAQPTPPAVENKPANLMSLVQQLVKIIDTLPADDAKKAKIKNILLQEIENESTAPDKKPETVVTDENQLNMKQSVEPVTPVSVSQPPAATSPINSAIPAVSAVDSFISNISPDQSEKIKEIMARVREMANAQKTQNSNPLGPATASLYDKIILARFAEKIEPISKELAEMIDEYIEKDLKPERINKLPPIPSEAMLVKA